MRATQNPQIRTACTSIIAEASVFSFSNMYEQAMDALAYKIAVHMYEIEKNDKEK